MHSCTQSKKTKYLNLASLLYAPLYFIFFTFYFLFFAIISLIFRPFKKPTIFSQKHQILDGISIIIPTWNKRDLIISCLQNLDQILANHNLKIPFEIIVIENGSQDDSLMAIRNLKLKTPLIILPQKENLGFSRAINLGVSRASYNYVYLMNNDMVVQPETFPPLIKYVWQLIEKKENFFAVASHILPFSQTTSNLESGKTYASFNYGFINVGHYLTEKDLKIGSQTFYAGGGSSLFHKKLFTFLGGYDHESYQPLYVEDLDLSYLAKKNGFKSYFCFDSKIIHHHRSSTKMLKADLDFIIQKNFLIFLWKNLSNPCYIFQHLFIYPLQIILKPKHCLYFIEAFKTFRQVFKQRFFISKKFILLPDKF